jgi:hypothetical protein
VQVKYVSVDSATNPKIKISSGNSAVNRLPHTDRFATFSAAVWALKLIQLVICYIDGGVSI